MKTLPFWKKSLYSALIFFGTLIVLSVGYSAWNAAMSKVSPGNPLSAAGWNALVDNIADLDSRWSRSGGNLVFTGGNVGVGTTSPQTPMHIMGSISAPSISGTPNGSLMIGSNETGVQVAMGITADVSPQYGWIQPRYANNGNVHNLVLNPNGGNVWIGIITPTQKLDVNGGGVLRGMLFIGDGTSSDIRKIAASTALNFRKYDGTIEMTIDASSNVWIAGGLTVHHRTSVSKRTSLR